MKMTGRRCVWLALLLLLVAAAAVSGQDGTGKKRGKTVKKQLESGPSSAEEGDAPEVQTSLGGLRGRWVRTRGGRKVAAFTKVPYGQPPVGDLRFKVV